MTNLNAGGALSAWTRRRDADEAAAELAGQFDDLDPRAIFVFLSANHDGAAITRTLHQRYPRAQVLGCTTAGDFTDRAFGTGSVSALALDGRKVKRCAAAIANLAHGVQPGVDAALGGLARTLGVDLRELDGRRYVGVMLAEGLKMREEAVNEALGNHAPLISFVGGSAGDNLEFSETRVFCNGEVSTDGVALMLLEMAVPFTVTKTCSFESTGKVFEATRVDEATRTLYELDGRPVAEVYAEAVGTTPDRLDAEVFMSSPLGQFIGGAPWIRSPQQLLKDGGLRFYCRISGGLRYHVMRSTDLVEDTRKALREGASALGRPIAGGLFFNCILRRLEVDARKLQKPFYDSFAGMQAGGFHTYGESWLGHINQTLTGLLIA